MGVKRYFQLFYVWPIVLPVVVLLLPAGVVANWVLELCREVLYSGGVPYLLFAGAMLFWSWDKEGASVRRSTYLAPLLFLPAFAFSLLIAWRRASMYPQELAELFVMFFLYGLVFTVPVSILGYGYVGLVNLAFVILRSVGAFGDEPIGTYAGFQSEGEYCGRGSVEYAGRASWSCGWVEPARNPRAAAFADGVSPISGSVSPTGMGMCADRSPYGFAGWEDEKMKGASRSGPEVATAGCVARDAATA